MRDILFVAVEVIFGAREGHRNFIWCPGGYRCFIWWPGGRVQNELVLVMAKGKRGSRGKQGSRASEGGGESEGQGPS